MRRFVFIALAALATSAMVGGGTALADVYTYTDKNGVVHYTNIKPKGGRFQLLYKTGTKKAAKPRCKGCDAVPAKDTSKARFSRFDQFILGAARLYRIPVALIRAVIYVESNYDPRVVSSAGAKGLMQLMPLTAKDMGVVDVFDPRQNVYGGTRYLRVLANLFNGDLVLTLAGYHAGPAAVSKYRGIPPYQVTHKYVRAVMRLYYFYKRREGLPPAKRASVTPPPAPTSRDLTP